MRLCRRRPVVKNSCSANYRCMTHDIDIHDIPDVVKNIIKTRTNKHKQTDVLLYVNDVCGLNNCYSIKCNKQQEKYCVSRAKTCTLGRVHKIGIGPDRTGSRIASRIGLEKETF